jgi:TPR repeat protein
VSQDYTEAMKWYRKAADAGNASAMRNIGWLYHNGLGVSQDYTEAMKWFRKADDAGNIFADQRLHKLENNKVETGCAVVLALAGGVLLGSFILFGLVGCK